MIDITHITNYKKYFKNNKLLYPDILNVIKEFKDYYEKQKIEMLMIHLDKNLEVNKSEYQNENDYNELLNKFDELDFETKNSLSKTSIGAKSSFSWPAVVKVVDQLELFNHSQH